MPLIRNYDSPDDLDYKILIVDKLMIVPVCNMPFNIGQCNHVLMKIKQIRVLTKRRSNYFALHPCALHAMSKWNKISQARTTKLAPTGGKFGNYSNEVMKKIEGIQNLDNLILFSG